MTGVGCRLSAGCRAALALFQPEERATAVASFDCEHRYIHPVEEQLVRE